MFIELIFHLWRFTVNTGFNWKLQHEFAYGIDYTDGRYFRVYFLGLFFSFYMNGPDG